MGNAHLALFSPLSLVFLLTLLALCSAVPAPAPDYTFTFLGHTVTVHTPTFPTGKSGNGNPFGNGFGHGGNPFNPFDPPKDPPAPPKTSTPTQKPTPPPAPPPPPPTSQKPDPPKSQANVVQPQKSSTPASSSHLASSSTVKQTSDSAKPTIPAGISTGSQSEPISKDPTTLPASSPTASPVSASSSKPIAAIIIPIIVVVILLLLALAALFVRRRRARARAEEAATPPMSQWLGNEKGEGAWSRLDMASRYDLASPAGSFRPNASPSPTPRTMSGGPATITPYLGAAMSVSTFTTPPASTSGHSFDEPSYARHSPEFAEDNASGMLTPSTAAPTAGHGSTPYLPDASEYAAYPFPVPPSHDPYEHTAPGDVDDRRQSSGTRNARTEDGHSLFAADSPFEMGTDFQDEPALAESRPTSLDAPRGSTLLAYTRDSRAVPDEFDPRHSQLM
ncbi:hypothetical protein R3P38DRAFT_2951903 [Favolaschia claudopus]|uniref:Uncharacterized protein n=1 Tax=Favolaschia claudopus TaxID=2862362 RepID=A0AAW0BGG2_9AGAR